MSDTTIADKPTRATAPGMSLADLQAFARLTGCTVPQAAWALAPKPQDACDHFMCDGHRETSMLCGSHPAMKPGV